MFTHNITYTDFLGNEQTEKLRFNISESEMMDLVKEDRTFSVDYLSYLVHEQNGLQMLDVIRKLIVASYGELSEDGKHFKKSDEIATAFVQSAAYNQLITEFIENKNENFVRDFMLGTFPAKFAQQMQEEASKVKALPVNK